MYDGDRRVRGFEVWVWVRGTRVGAGVGAGKIVGMEGKRWRARGGNRWREGMAVGG